LFVVPATIVLVIVAIWVLFNWLANMGSDSLEYLEQIRKQNANSWIAAHNLAEELRTKPALRQDAEIARELGRMLEESLEAGGWSKDDIQLRVFLCRALGEFHVSDGFPALIKAAQTQRREEDLDVRRSALEAIALLVSHVREHATSSTFDASQLLPTLLAASREDEAALREGAAYALGVIGGEEANARLVQMLSDGRPDVRFNAATGLARQGREECRDVLLEMLDVSELKGVDEEDGPKARDFKRALIAINGLRAVRQLIDARPDLDRTELEKAVQALATADLSKDFAQQDYTIEVRAQAESLLEHWHPRP
jgi:HEAT repeat protein